MGLKRDPQQATFCRTGKARLTKSAAKSTAKRQEKMHGARADAYECSICSSWHVGKRHSQWKSRRG